MTTGVKIHDELVIVYQSFKLSSNKNQYMVMNIEKGKIQLEKMSDSTDYQAFFNDVAKPELPRYALKKMQYKSLDGRPCEKIVFLSWYKVHIHIIDLFYFECFDFAI